MKLRTAVALAATALLAACAHMKNDQTVCPEYRALRCLSAPECSMDSSRGCRVCQCSRVDGGAETTPPDQRSDMSRPPTN